MKKIILTTILLINSVFASSDIINKIELYKTGIEILANAITTNNGKPMLDESKFPHISDESNFLLHTHFTHRSDVLSTIKKYSKKVTRYLEDVLYYNINHYTEINGEIDSANEILRRAIKNATSGNKHKTQENINGILSKYYEDFIYDNEDILMKYCK